MEGENNQSTIAPQAPGANQPPNVPNVPMMNGANVDPMAVMVAAMLEQMQGKFEQMSGAILGRIDTMSERINELEETIADLMKRAGVTPEEVARMQEERRRAKAAAASAEPGAQ